MQLCDDALTYFTAETGKDASGKSRQAPSTKKFRTMHTQLRTRKMIQPGVRKNSRRHFGSMGSRSRRAASFFPEDERQHKADGQRQKEQRAADRQPVPCAAQRPAAGRPARGPERRCSGYAGSWTRVWSIPRRHSPPAGRSRRQTASASGSGAQGRTAAPSRKWQSACHRAAGCRSTAPRNSSSSVTGAATAV